MKYYLITFLSFGLFFIGTMSLMSAGNTFTGPSKPRLEETEISEYINKIKSGDEDFLKTVMYSDLQYALTNVVIDPLQKYDGTVFSNPFVLALLSEDDNKEELRRSLITAFTGGLYNKDPRVRLVSIDFLRCLGTGYGQDRTAVEHIKIALQIETQRMQDQPSFLTQYINFAHNGKLVEEVPYERLVALYKYVIRNRILFQLENENPNILKDLPSKAYQVLAEPLDMHDEDKFIPFNYMIDTHLDKVLMGLDNNDYIVDKDGKRLYWPKDYTMQALLKTLRRAKVDMNVKLKIYNKVINDKDYRKYLIKDASDEIIPKLDPKKVIEAYTKNYGELEYYTYYREIQEDKRSTIPKLFTKEAPVTVGDETKAVKFNNSLLKDASSTALETDLKKEEEKRLAEEKKRKEEQLKRVMAEFEAVMKSSKVVWELEEVKFNK